MYREPETKEPKVVIYTVSGGEDYVKTYVTKYTKEALTLGIPWDSIKTSMNIAGLQDNGQSLRCHQCLAAEIEKK